MKKKINFYKIFVALIFISFSIISYNLVFADSIVDNYAIFDNDYGYKTVYIKQKYNPTPLSITEMTAIIEVKLYKEKISGITTYSLIDAKYKEQFLLEDKLFDMKNIYTSIRKKASNYAEINISGLLSTTSEKFNSNSLNAESLKNIGFNVSNTKSKNWIARLPYNECLRFYIN